jgi:hypothetical protein
MFTGACYERELYERERERANGFEDRVYELRRQLRELRVQLGGELAEVEEQRDLLLAACEAALATVCGNEECRPDHHGLCQAHNLDRVDRCWVRLCREAVERAKGEGP